MVFTVPVAAKELVRTFFIMFDNHDAAAQVTFLVDRLVPEDKVAVRILAAAVKDAASFRLALDERPLAAFRAGNAQIFDDGLGVAAFREVGAGQEFAEAAEFIDHRRPADFADLTRFLTGNGDLFHLRFGLVHFRLKDVIKFLQDVGIRIVALFDGVEGFFHMGRKADVDDAGKVFFRRSTMMTPSSVGMNCLSFFST